MLGAMVAVERAVSRGARRGRRACLDLEEEFRLARLGAGWSQDRVARAVGISRSHYVDIEGGRVGDLAIVEASRIAAVLGLDLAVRAYPGSGPLRDAAHARRLAQVLGPAAAPLRVRMEVPLPASPGRSELRAWDAVVSGSGKRTAVELEMRFRDGQAVERRLSLKRRDDPVDQFVLLVADTKSNRRVLASSPTMFADLPRLGPLALSKHLEAGNHPPSCLVVV
jgi:transcriptional regulator with XRE-family HTH domain